MVDILEVTYSKWIYSTSLNKQHILPEKCYEKCWVKMTLYKQGWSLNASLSLGDKLNLKNVSIVLVFVTLSNNTWTKQTCL